MPSRALFQRLDPYQPNPSFLHELSRRSFGKTRLILLFFANMFCFCFFSCVMENCPLCRVRLDASHHFDCPNICSLSPLDLSDWQSYARREHTGVTRTPSEAPFVFFFLGWCRFREHLCSGLVVPSEDTCEVLVSLVYKVSVCLFSCVYFCLMEVSCHTPVLLHCFRHRCKGFGVVTHVPYRLTFPRHGCLASSHGVEFHSFKKLTGGRVGKARKFSVPIFL